MTSGSFSTEFSETPLTDEQSLKVRELKFEAAMLRARVRNRMPELTEQILIHQIQHGGPGYFGRLYGIRAHPESVETRGGGRQYLLPLPPAKP